MTEINEQQRISYDGRRDDPRTVFEWYDFLCPFCYVGQHRTAILVRHGLHVVELPFQAHPDIPAGGIPAGPRNGPMYAMLEREAREAGLPLNWAARLPDTRRPWLLPSGSGCTSHASSPSYTRTSLKRTLSSARTSGIPP